jgi:sialate O-acetylesterase
MILFNRFYIGLIAGLATTTASWSTVAVSNAFGSNMVLQRGKPVPVWGTASSGENVSVQFNSQTKSMVTGASGVWKVTLDSMAVSTSALQMVVKGTNTVTLTNILIGDVWLCSGQSNMAFGLGAFGYTAGAEAMGMTFVRLHNLYPVGGWSECSPSTAGSFSATAFFFGRYIYDSLKIPIGLVTAARGSTSVEQWMSVKSVIDDPVLDTTTVCPICAGGTASWNKSQAAGFYQECIAAFVPFAIKGAIWYQGEQNTNTTVPPFAPATYMTHFKELIEGWRYEWNEGEFPFYFVQLPNYNGGNGWAMVREQQRLTLNAVKNTGMAITIDIGEAANIHPADKRDVGYRLALQALERTYGHSKLVSSGPLFKSFYVKSDTAHLSFDYIGTGLITKNGTLSGFEVAPKDTDFTAGSAFIRNNEVLVYKAGSKVVNVRYAYAGNPTASLFNKEGFPASPFRTYASDVVNVDNRIGSVMKPASSLSSPRINYHSGSTIEIVFGLPGAGMFSVQIYDARGKLMRTVVNENRRAGAYRVLWNGRDLRGKVTGEGVYYCRILLNGTAIINPFILVR